MRSPCGATRSLRLSLSAAQLLLRERGCYDEASDRREELIRALQHLQLKARAVELHYFAIDCQQALVAQQLEPQRAAAQGIDAIAGALSAAAPPQRGKCAEVGAAAQRANGTKVHPTIIEPCTRQRALRAPPEPRCPLIATAFSATAFSAAAAT